MILKALIYALFGEPPCEDVHIPYGPSPHILGEEDVSIGDRFSGYACGHYFTDQTVSGFTEEGLVMGTTTLAVFKKENIIKYDS